MTDATTTIAIGFATEAEWDLFLTEKFKDLGEGVYCITAEDRDYGFLNNPHTNTKKSSIPDTHCWGHGMHIFLPVDTGTGICYIIDMKGLRDTLFQGTVSRCVLVGFDEEVKKKILSLAKTDNDAAIDYIEMLRKPKTV